VTRNRKIAIAAVSFAGLLLLFGGYFCLRPGAEQLSAFVWVLHDVPGRSAFHSWQSESMLQGVVETSTVSLLHKQGFAVSENLDAKQLRRLQLHGIAAPAAALIKAATGAQIAVLIELHCSEQAAVDASSAQVRVVLNGRVQRLDDESVLARATEEATVTRNAGDTQDFCEQAAALVAQKLAKRLLNEASLRLGHSAH
jgi:hypothetical protein